MKALLASTALVLFISGPVMVQADTNEFVTEAQKGDIYGSDLMGMRLYVTETNFDENTPVTADTRSKWNDVGEINDLLITQGGNVEAVLLDIGGFLGIGEKTIGVSMDNLKFLHDQDNPDDFFVAMNGTQESLENAPEFHRAATATVVKTTDVKANSTNADRHFDRPVIEREGYVPLKVTDLTVEDLEGANVYGADDKSIGQIEDLVVGSDGEVKEAILDIGGFLGIDEHRIAINFDEMQILRSKDGSDLRVHVSATKEQLEARPDYKG